MNNSKLWHQLTVDQALSGLETTRHGLTAAQASERLLRHGRNSLPQPARRGPLLRFLLQFHNILIYVLLGSALITALMSHWIDTGVILAVVLANAVIGFIQEGKAEQAMNAIRRMPPCCAAASGSASRWKRWCPATSCCWKRATRCRRICG
jgi:magnesium-transporting ATPase (P-type)